MQLELNNLTKYYEGKTILNNLNLHIDSTKVVGIIGESGCGKSTLLRQLAGIEFPEKGIVIINGMEITKNNLKTYQDNISVVFQKHSLFPHLTIEQNILLILEKIKDMNKFSAQKRCEEVLKEFHLNEQSNKVPSKISGGQAQRASIARAVATNPNLIFLDEPTAALDPLLTKEVLNSISRLKTKGAEFIFVTHEMNFLKELADYFVFMDKGKIIEHGPIETLKKSHTEKLKKFINTKEE